MSSRKGVGRPRITKYQLLQLKRSLILDKYENEKIRLSRRVGIWEKYQKIGHLAKNSHYEGSVQNVEDFFSIFFFNFIIQFCNYNYSTNSIRITKELFPTSTRAPTSCSEINCSTLQNDARGRFQVKSQRRGKIDPKPQRQFVCCNILQHHLKTLYQVFLRQKIFFLHDNKQQKEFQTFFSKTNNLQAHCLSEEKKNLSNFFLWKVLKDPFSALWKCFS